MATEKRSKYSNESKLGLEGTFGFVFASSCGHFIQEDLRKTLKIPDYWINIELGMIFALALFFIWISDCYGARKTVSFITFLCPLASVLIMTPTYLVMIPYWLQTCLYVGASLSIVWSYAGVGILLSLLFEQMSVDALTMKQDLMKYILYFLLIYEWSEFLSEVNWWLMSPSSFAIAASTTSLISYVVIEVTFYRGNYQFEVPSEHNALKNCLTAFFRRNVYLKTTQKTPDEEASLRLMAVLFPHLWYLCYQASHQLFFSFVRTKSSICDSKWFSITTKTLVMALLHFLLDLTVHWLKGKKYFRMSLHLISVGFLVISFYFFLLLMNFINFSFSPNTFPVNPGFGQLRFYNFVRDSHLKISLEGTNLFIPYLSVGSFLNTPVSNENEVTAIIVENNLVTDVTRTYLKKIKVLEMESMSYLVCTNHSVIQDGPDPLKYLNPNVQNSYFYVFGSHSANSSYAYNMTFYQGKSMMYDFRFPTDVRFFHVNPGRYNVSKTKDDRKEVELKNGYVYCAVYYNIAYNFFHIATFMQPSNVGLFAEIIGGIGVSLLRAGMLHFIQTESPTYLKGTTFSLWLLSENLAELVIKRIWSFYEVNKVFWMEVVILSTPFLTVVLAAVALYYANEFHFSNATEI